MRSTDRPSGIPTAPSRTETYFEVAIERILFDVRDPELLGFVNLRRSRRIFCRVLALSLLSRYSSQSPGRCATGHMVRGTLVLVDRLEFGDGELALGNSFMKWAMRRSDAQRYSSRRCAQFS